MTAPLPTEITVSSSDASVVFDPRNDLSVMIAVSKRHDLICFLQMFVTLSEADDHCRRAGHKPCSEETRK